MSRLASSMRGLQDGLTVFDLAMPDRPYTEVVLDLRAPGGADFVAAAEVFGVGTKGEAPTELGTFTLFDLTRQHLARSLTLHLQESRFRTLHVALRVSAAGGPSLGGVGKVLVAGAVVPPSREAETLYTTVATADAITQRGRTTLASFRLPAYVPVERVAFALAPNYEGSFSREVAVTAHAVGCGRRQAG